MSCLANLHRTILKENADELLRALAKRNIPGATSREDLLIEKNSCGSDALIFACLTGNIEIIHIINDALKKEGAFTNNKERNAIDYLLEHMRMLEEKIGKLEASIKDRKNDVVYDIANKIYRCDNVKELEQIYRDSLDLRLSDEDRERVVKSCATRKGAIKTRMRYMFMDDVINGKL